jgi:2-oxoglutarate dehydrogenase E1 component
MSQSLADQLATTALSGGNAGFIEDLYEQASAKQGAVSRLIQVYANRGHLIANLDPLGLQERARPYVLDSSTSVCPMPISDTEFFTGSRNEHSRARQAQGYPGAAEIHLLRHHRRRVRARLGFRRAPVAAGHLPVGRMQRRFSVDEKKNILWQLTAAEGLERYLHTKYVGQKRFSLEGGESVDPRCSTTSSSRAGRPASKRPSSAWRIAAASTCW